MDIIIIIISIAVVLYGADHLTKGASVVARRLKMSEMVIGLTIVALGTSMPELCVSLTSAASGTADMAVGNVVGSNIFNIFLIVGICATVRPMSVTMDTIRHDLPFAFAASVALIAMLYDGTVSRIEGLLLFASFIAYMTYTIRHAKSNTSEAEEKAEEHTGKLRKVFANPVVLIILGLAELILGSNYFVLHATSLATSLGVSEAVIGITILGFGTSMPELATSLVAAARGKAAIAMGNVIGSCIFNILMIVGLTASILPLATEGITLKDLVMLFAGALLLWVFSATKKTMERWEGILLTALFIAYITFLLI